MTILNFVQASDHNFVQESDSNFAQVSDNDFVPVSDDNYVLCGMCATGTTASSGLTVDVGSRVLKTLYLVSVDNVAWYSYVIKLGTSSKYTRCPKLCS